MTSAFINHYFYHLQYICASSFVLHAEYCFVNTMAKYQQLNHGEYMQQILLCGKPGQWLLIPLPLSDYCFVYCFFHHCKLSNCLMGKTVNSVVLLCGEHPDYTRQQTRQEPRSIYGDSNFKFSVSCLPRSVVSIKIPSLHVLSSFLFYIAQA